MMFSHGLPSGPTWLRWVQPKVISAHFCNTCARRHREVHSHVACSFGPATSNNNSGYYYFSYLRLCTCAAEDVGGHFPATRCASHLCGAALWGNGSGTDGGLSNLLLRVPLSLYQCAGSRGI